MNDEAKQASQAARPTATPLAVGLRSAEEASPRESLTLDLEFDLAVYELCDAALDRVETGCSSLSRAFLAVPADSELGSRSSDCLK